MGHLLNANLNGNTIKKKSTMSQSGRHSTILIKNKGM